jgi:hypothetical protein
MRSISWLGTPFHALRRPMFGAEITARMRMAWQRAAPAAVVCCSVACSSGPQVLGWQTDVELPWYGGSGYFRPWKNGPPASPDFWMRSVWMQNPTNVARYRAVGVNFYTGLWEGPTEDQLAALTESSMPAICEQAGVWASHVADSTMRGWLQPDQPDGAQEQGDGTYGPCMAPSDLLALYQDKVAHDATRPVYLELGLGIVDPDWEGRGSCAGHPEQYDEYVNGGDMLGSVIYPIHSKRPLEDVAIGIDRLRAASHDQKPVIAVIEASAVDGVNRPTPAQLRAEIWMSVVHGAAGIEYYCHRIQPTVLETDCLDDAATAAELARNNQLLNDLAPALDTPPLASWVKVSSSPAARIDTLLKRYDGHVYLFAVEMQESSTTVTFQLRNGSVASVEVLGEGRTIAVSAGEFSDTFQSYGVHLYRLGN